MASLSPFGLSGPKSGWAATDLTVQAAGGLMFLTGEWDQPPMQLPPYAAALAGGLATASAVLAACRLARRDGILRRLDVSMVEALAAHTYTPTTRYVYRGEVMRREQRIKQALRMVPSSDGFVYCAPGAVRNVDMKGIARLTGEARLAEDRFQTSEGRMQNWDEFLELFVPPFAKKTAREWFEEAEALDLTFALVQTIDDLFTCPQLEARGLFREVQGPDGVAVRIPGRPFRLEDGPPGASRPAPSRPGEHTAEVIREWLG
jgi:crotonobetainyl-CoA:carnitine CoA-transferase CaiB-like acyl-CoA transferase